VPCSLLAGLFAQLEAPGSAARLAGLRYLPAPREDSALGPASGAALAGERAVVLLQNSGRIRHSPHQLVQRLRDALTFTPTGPELAVDR
jgi:sulfopyruvate decarboxylase TPP-binding subunit